MSDVHILLYDILCVDLFAKLLGVELFFFVKLLGVEFILVIKKFLFRWCVANYTLYIMKNVSKTTYVLSTYYVFLTSIIIYLVEESELQSRNLDQELQAFCSKSE